MITYIHELCAFRNESIDRPAGGEANYISTETMLSNKGGVSKTLSAPSTSKVKVFCKGDTLVSNIRPYFKKIWQAEYDGCCSNDVLVFQATKCSPDFLYWLLSDDSFFDYVNKTSKGTKMPRGDKSAIMKYEVNLPNSEDQNKICSVLNSLQSKIKINIQLNDYLAEYSMMK